MVYAHIFLVCVCVCLAVFCVYLCTGVCVCVCVYVCVLMCRCVCLCTGKYASVHAEMPEEGVWCPHLCIPYVFKAEPLPKSVVCIFQLDC